MRFLIVDTYYPSVLRAFYARQPDVANQTYSEQKRALMDHCFGTADFYSSNLRRLGREAEEIVANCEPLQRAWARQHGDSWPMAITESRKNRQLLRVLKHQIERAKPDALYVQSLYWPGSEFLREVRDSVKLVVGQIAYGLEPTLDLAVYDLILTSFPHFVDRFRHMGGNSEYFRLGFEATILDRLEGSEIRYPAGFVGTYSGPTGAHPEGTRLLEYVASRVPVHFWGQGQDALRPDSPIRHRFNGEAWGTDMYGVLAQAGIVLNRHAGWAERYANNMRLYEATGVGAMLLTDDKDNLNDLFLVGKEVVAYRSQYECVEYLKYYLEHEDERAAIAAAGQRRTLNEHTYYHRMQELLQIVDRYLRHPEQTTGRRFPAPEITSVDTEPTVTQQLSGVARGIMRHTLLAGPARSARAMMKHSPLAAPARWLGRRMHGRSADNYQVISPSMVNEILIQGWQSRAIPEKQRDRVNWELCQMYLGEVSPAFQAAAEAVAATDMQHGAICEVGCASGYYFEVLEHLLGHRVNYTGLDYSQALIERARQEYPGVQFRVADATDLLLDDDSYAIVMSGCVLLHVMDYRQAVAETARVASDWCIFHRTPVMQGEETALMTRMAYGVPVVELAFGERELLALFAENGLQVMHEFLIGRHRLSALREPVEMKTYVAEKQVQR